MSASHHHDREIPEERFPEQFRSRPHARCSHRIYFFSVFLSSVITVRQMNIVHFGHEAIIEKTIVAPAQIVSDHFTYQFLIIGPCRIPFSGSRYICLQFSQIITVEGIPCAQISFNVPFRNIPDYRQRIAFFARCSAVDLFTDKKDFRIGIPFSHKQSFPFAIRQYFLKIRRPIALFNFHNLIFNDFSEITKDSKLIYFHPPLNP